MMTAHVVDYFALDNFSSLTDIRNSKKNPYYRLIAFINCKLKYDIYHILR